MAIVPFSLEFSGVNIPEGFVLIVLSYRQYPQLLLFMKRMSVTGSCNEGCLLHSESVSQAPVRTGSAENQACWKQNKHERPMLGYQVIHMMKISTQSVSLGNHQTGGRRSLRSSSTIIFIITFLKVNVSQSVCRNRQQLKINTYIPWNNKMWRQDSARKTEPAQLFPGGLALHASASQWVSKE